MDELKREIEMLKQEFYLARKHSEENKFDARAFKEIVKIAKENNIQRVHLGHMNFEFHYQQYPCATESQPCVPANN